MHFASALGPQNQSLALSLIDRGAPQLHRLSRWLAHSLLLSNHASAYSALPALPPLTACLGATDGPFAMQPEMEVAAYEALGHRIDILSVAVIGVDEYVQDEARVASVAGAAAASSSSSSASPSPARVTGEKPSAIVELRRALDAFNGQIGGCITSNYSLGAD
jgi:hypothetical protein